MAICSFCGTTIPAGTGLMFVKKDAKVLWFCSRKCEKNMLVLGRKPRNIAWTEEAHTNKRAAMAAAAKGIKVEESKEKKAKKSKSQKAEQSAEHRTQKTEDGDDE